MRSRINTHEYNKKAKKRYLTREQIIKDKFGEMNEGQLSSAIQQAMHMQYVLDSEAKKKIIEFGSDTTILGSQYINKRSSKYASLSGAENTYAKIKPFFSYIENINSHLKNKQTGNSLISNAIELDKGINYTRMITKANSSVMSMNEVYNNFKNATSFTVFDTETFSGMGRTGYNELDSIQEIAFRTFNKVNNNGVMQVVEDESKRMETLIGISQAQYDEYYEALVKNFDKGTWRNNNKYKVIADRLAKTGHKDTVIENSGYGTAITKSFASNESENLLTIDNIRKGLNIELSLGKRQNAERLSNGLMVWEDYLLRSVGTFNNDFVAGYNSTNFDLEKMNQQVAKVWSGIKNEDVKNQYRALLGISNGAIPTINPTPGRYLDFRDPVRMAAEKIGKTGVYNNNDDLLSMIKGMGTTLLQQESLGKAFVGDSFITAPHTAGADVTVLANLMGATLEDGSNFFDKMIKAVNDNASNVVGNINKNSVLMATQGEFFNDFTRKGALNFTAERTKGDYRLFNGYSLDANGDVRNLGDYGHATGIKKDVAYKIDSMFELDMSEEWVKEIAPIHQDYAQGKLWGLTVNPLMNKSISNGNEILEDPTTYFFTSKEAMEGFVSSHFAHVGNIDGNGKIQELTGKAGKEIRDLYKQYEVVDGKLQEIALNGNTNLVENLVDSGTIKAMNDPAARAIRENEYSKAVKFNKLQDYLTENGAATISEQKKALSLITAKNVASNKTLRISHDKVMDILGYKDRATEKQVLMTNTLNNTLNGYEYNASMRNVVDSVMSEISRNSNLSEEQKQFMFQNYMQNLRQDAANLIANNPEEAERLAKGNQNLRLFAKDLDYFEIDMPTGYFKNTNNKSMPGEIDDVLRINLKAEKEYSLVNDLLKRKFGDDDRILKNKNLRESYGMHELKNLIGAIAETDDYKELYEKSLKDIEFNDNVNVDAMSERIITAFKNARKDNPIVGFSKTREVQNVLSADTLLPSLSDDFIKSSIGKTTSNLSDLNIFNSGNKEMLDSYIGELVDEILMPKVTDKNGNILSNITDIVNHAQQLYGYNQATRDNLERQLSMIRKDHVEGMRGFVKPIMENGGLVFYDKNKKTIGMNLENEVYNLFAMPKTRFEDGVLYHQVGANKVASSFTIDTDRALYGSTFDRARITMRSNLSGAYDETRYLSSSIKRSIERGEKPSKAILRTLGRLSEKARELPSIGKNTIKDMYSWQEIDMSGLLNTIPEMLDMMNGYTGWQDEEMMDIFRRNRNSMRSGFFNSEVQEAFAKNKQDIAKFAFGIGGGNLNPQMNDAQAVLATMGSNTKDTHLSKSHASTGEFTPYALGEFDNPSRPVINQSINSRLFRKQDLEDFAKTTNGVVDVGSRLTTARGKTAFNRNILGLGETEVGVTQTTAIVAEKNFRKALVNRYEELGGDNADEYTKKVFKQMTGLNLTEQAKILDGRVAKTMMSGTEIQTINTLKNFNRDLSINSRMMNQRIERSMPVIQIAKSGEIVFKLGKEDFVRRNEPLLTLNGYGGVIDTIGAKEDFGFFGNGYFAKNTDALVDESSISRFLNNNKSRIKTVEDARRLLDENFTNAFYVKNATIKGYNKGTYEGVEKGMFEALLSGVGTLNDDVAKALDVTGYGDMKGRILTDQFVDDILINSYNNLSPEKRKATGFANATDLKSAINKEMFAMTDFFKGIKGFEDVTSVSVDNISKHKNAGMATRQLINDIAYSFMTGNTQLNADEAYEKTYTMLKDNNVFKGIDITFNNGKIEFGETDPAKSEILVNNIEQMMDKLDLSNFNITDSDGNVIGRKSRMLLMASNDYSGTSRSNREIGPLYSQLRGKMNELSGLEKGTVEYDKALDDVNYLQNRLRAAKRFDKEMKITSREVDMMGLYEYSDEYLNKARAVYGNEYSSYLGSARSGEKIYKGLLGQFEQQADRNVKGNLSTLKDSMSALGFNGGSVNKNYLIGQGFEEASIGDLIPAIGTDNSFLLDSNDPNRAFGRNLLINTGLSDDKYVAISNLNPSITGNNVNTDEVQKALGGMSQAYNRWQTGELSEGETLKDLETAYRKSITKVRDAMDTESQKLFQDAKTIKVDGYNYQKASMAMYDATNKTSNYSMYNVSKVGNKTLGELADTGAHVGASWHGLSYFENLGYLDESYYKQYGMKTKDEMIERLMTDGTMAFGLRTPTIKEGSITVERQYLDPSLKDMSKATAPLIARRNQDHDGDSAIHGEIRYDATGDSYATYRLKRDQGVDMAQEEIDFFAGLENASNFEAATVNAQSYESMKNLYENKEVKNALNAGNSVSVLKESQLRSGIVSPYSQYELDSNIRNEYQRKYGEIEGALKNELGEGYNSLTQLERASKFDGYITNNKLDDTYKDAVKMVEIFERDMGVTMAKSSKGSIGFINTPLAALRRTADSAGFDSNTLQYLQATSDLLEEAMISRKHGSATAISMTQQLRGFVNDMVGGKTSGIEGITNIMKNHMSDDIYEKIQTANMISGSDKMTKEQFLANATEAIERIGNAFYDDKSLRNVYKAQNIDRNISRNNVESMRSGIDDANDLFNRVLRDNGLGTGITSNGGNAKVDTDGYVRAGTTLAKDTVEDIVHGIGNSSGLAKAALGLAAAVMVTGYIGGNPTTPAGYEAQQEDMNNYQSLQDKDLSIQSLPGGTGQGYVININAQSSKGQEHVAQAIQKAMYSSVTTDINISMNINDRTSNINSRFIDSLLTGAL